MFRLLLLMPATSYRARDFLAAAATLGVDVVVGSDHRQVLERHSHGRSLFVNLGDTDQGVSTIVDHARRLPVDAVIGTDDESVLLAAAAARALGLPHNPVDAVTNARDKLRFRQTLQAAGIPGPRYKVLSLDRVPGVEPLAFPCVVKPRSLSASRGVLRVNDAAELAAACERIDSILASVRPDGEPGNAQLDNRRTVLLEEYIHGDEVALEGMLDDGTLQVLALFDKPDPMHGPTFEETLLVTPSRLDRRVQDAIVDTVQRTVEVLGLREGPVHAEIRVNHRGAWMVELAPRTVGGLCSRSLHLEGGESLETRVIRNALGMAAPVLDTGGTRAVASGVMMIAVPHQGRLQRVAGIAAARKVPGVDDVIISVAVGEHVVPLPEGDRYLGFIFARGASPEDVEQALRAAHGALEMDISAG